MVLANEEALLEAWSAKDVPGVLVSVETRHKFHAAEIDKHYKATGELLPGCELRAAEDAFYIS